MNDRERRIIDYIGAYSNVNGYAPTFRQIARAVGYKSTSTVTLRLRSMRQRGLVAFEDQIARTVRVMEGTPA